MRDDPRELLSRLKRVLDTRLAAARFPRVDVPLTLTAWDAPAEPVAFAEAKQQSYAPTQTGERWGRAWRTRWFHLTGTLPAKLATADLELLVDLGFGGNPGFSCEGLAYRPDGSLVRGLHPRANYLPLTERDRKINFYIEAAANPDLMAAAPQPTSLGEWDESAAPLYQVGEVAVVRRDSMVAGLFADLEVLGELAAELADSDPRRWQLLRALRRSLDELNVADLAGSAAAARAQLAAVLAAPARASAHRITAIGHAHIDSAWLWPVRETVRKLARTVSNVLALAQTYPDLVFAFSAAQHHAWIKQFYPELFTRLVAAVTAGTVVPVGGMWVESDTNLVGAEALARQFVHGKRFFLANYGIETDEVWLPDSFGYAAGLPQIVRQSNSQFLLTQKLSWNETNTFPHHTFWWEGIDGSQVFTHFPPADTYNAEVRGRELAHAAGSFADASGAGSSLLPFGFGDGGGGPTREQLDRMARVRDLEGSPKVRLGRPDEFFAAARAEYPDAPVWAGELYLERHRGTYTSQARTKSGNRRSEHLLYEAELWATTAAVRGKFAYPYAELERLWQRVLLHQFHDILPGSSIAWVHREAEAAYAEIADELEAIISSAQNSLAGKGKVAITFNPAPQSQQGVPGFGAAVATPAAKIKVTRSAGIWQISNGLLTAQVDRNGQLVSLIDHEAELEADDREVLAGPSNVWQLHPDTPRFWDAWDIDSSYRNRMITLDAVESITQITGGVKIVRKFQDSTATQTITLAAGIKQVDFSVDLDWQEREMLLKAAFDLDVQAEHSYAETQFGHLARPTHTNTSWERAKFEFCAQRYLYLPEPGYGVALLNDSSYGHDVTRRQRAAGSGYATLARLSLLRAPGFPDPQADLGTHQLRYSLLVGCDAGAAAAAGIALNTRPRVVADANPVRPLVQVDNPDVIISAVKLADPPIGSEPKAASGDVVVRLYQATGGRSRVQLNLGFSAKSVQVVDLLERPLADATALVSWQDNSATVTLRPFQMITLRFAR